MVIQSMKSSATTRPVLVTVLGLKPKTLTYHLDGRQESASLSAVALARLLEEPPETILAVCTDEALETLRTLEAELAAAPGLEGLQTERLPVSAVDEEDLALKLVDELGRRLVDGRPVVMDLTHGPRHLAFLALAAILLASALGKADVRGVYYAWEQSGRFVDLRRLGQVLDVIHAARSYEETGSATALAKFLENVPGQESTRLQSLLRRTSMARLGGLPLELGRWAAELVSARKCLRRLLAQAGLPLADSIAAVAVDALGGKELSTTGSSWKKAIRLDWVELERQRKIIDERLALGDTSTALLMMEEWLTSWAIWQGNGQDHWLERSARQRAAHRLHHLRLVLQKEPARLTSDQKRVGKLWGALSEVRNAFAHAGMQAREVDLEKDQLQVAMQAVRDGWSWLAEERRVDLSTAGPSPLMVSPLGKLPGALYTALRKFPDAERCLVVCSSESAPHLPAIAAALGRSPDSFVLLQLEDPLAGAAEVEDLREQARRYLLDASEVYVHLTGGSTLMGYVCDSIGEMAEGLDRPVRYFLTLDRRDRTEQEGEPFVEGDFIELPRPGDDRRREAG